MQNTVRRAGVTMKRYEVKLVVELSKVIEASSREEALDRFDEVNADTRTIKFTARPIQAVRRIVRQQRIRESQEGGM